MIDLGMNEIASRGFLLLIINIWIASLIDDEVLARVFSSIDIDDLCQCRFGSLLSTFVLSNDSTVASLSLLMQMTIFVSREERCLAVPIRYTELLTRNEIMMSFIATRHFIEGN